MAVLWKVGRAMIQLLAKIALMLPCDNFTKIIYENTLPSKEFKLFMRQPFGVRTWSDVGVQRVFFHHFLPTP